MNLTFLTPWILAGSALVAVPIIIHLIMRKKPKHLIFPAFRFLQLKHRTNVRKVRLRHLLLLAMRIMLIILICAALARPELSGEGSVLATDAPVAVILLFDTSASMEYEFDGKSRLAEAKERAVRLLEQLPAGSRAAVMDTGEPGSQFATTREAIKHVQNRQVRYQNRPVTAALEEAYRLLEKEAPADLPLLFCIFSDRTAASWNRESVASFLAPLKNRVETALRRALPALYLDLSAPQPRNVAVTSLALRRGGSAGTPLEKLLFGASAKEPLQFLATVQVLGTKVSGELVLTMDGKEKDRKAFTVEAPPGQAANTVVSFSPLRIAANAHQGEVRLKNRDALEIDNVRYWSVVVPQRKALVLADQEDDAAMWAPALESMPVPMTCDVMTPDRAPRNLHPDQYQIVTLLNVARPDAELWQLLQRYVADGGGLVILPGEESDPEAYGTEQAMSVMPGRLKEKRSLRPPGAFLAPDFGHPIMAPFKEDWQRQNLSYWQVTKFWEIETSTDLARIVAPYSVEEKPAIIERVFDPQKVRGRVVMFTTAMYRRKPPAWKDWNNFHKEWIYFGLAVSTTRHVLGAREEPQNYLLGDPLRFWLPRGPGFNAYLLSGPLPASGAIQLGQTDLTIREAVRPGNYKVTDQGGQIWHRFFSVNMPASEMDLVSQRPEPSEIAALLGEESVFNSAHSADLLEIARAKLGQSPRKELLPLLMIGVLLLLAAENLLANRFYRKDPEQPQ